MVRPFIGDLEVVKVNQRGSSYSSNATYVNTLDPEVAVISVGKNSYGHPDPTIVARRDAIADVYQTQSPVDDALMDGDILISTAGVVEFTASASGSSRSVTRPLDETSP